jgi:hypothetical protein
MMAMKIRTIRPVESRLDEISWLRLLVRCPVRTGDRQDRPRRREHGGRRGAGPDQPVFDRERVERVG